MNCLLLKILCIISVFTDTVPGSSGEGDIGVWMSAPKIFRKEPFGLVFIRLRKYLRFSVKPCNDDSEIVSSRDYRSILCKISIPLYLKLH